MRTKYFSFLLLFGTLDGGHTLTKMAVDPGGDNHEMWIDPTNGDRMGGQRWRGEYFRGSRELVEPRQSADRADVSRYG